jgi:murein DD-endopeptidase MepM/ murein hydrolase activator NlpD
MFWRAYGCHVITLEIMSGSIRPVLLAVLVLLGLTAPQLRLVSDGAPLDWGGTGTGGSDGLSPGAPLYVPPAIAHGGDSAQGWTQPLDAPVVSGFRTFERPGHDGVDLAASRYTPIVAAASGTVISSYCDAIDVRDGSAWGCYRDGDPNLTSGCGWHVDIIHSGQEITRYCHMVSQPLVSVGDFVSTGQELGQVGSTGNSSGPHLHFEVHVNGDPGSGGAVDPETWMSDRGAPLGGWW